MYMYICKWHICIPYTLHDFPRFPFIINLSLRKMYFNMYLCPNKNPKFLANINVFHVSPSTSPLNTLLVPLQFLIVPDKRMVLIMSSPAL